MKFLRGSSNNSLFESQVDLKNEVFKNVKSGGVVLKAKKNWKRKSINYFLLEF